MPQLSDLVEKRKFVKKEYRPWDLSGTGTVDGKEKAEQLESSPAISKPDLPEEKPAIIKSPIIENTDTQVSIGNKTDNISDNKQITTEKRSENIKVTKTKQRDNTKITISEHLNNRIDNTLGNADDLFYLTNAIKRLAGIQKNIFLYVINVCSARGALDTGIILSTDLANAAHCSIGSVKTSLIRLVEKHLILRLQGKASRGGYLVLGITKEIQSAAIQAQQALFNPLKILQSDNITGNTTNNAIAYSSSIYNKNTTTSLPDNWKKIDFELLRHIGFSETQLRQLYDSHATDPEIVQDAIYRFAYSLEHNAKAKAYGEPLNVLMGVLRKGQRWNEPNYISSKELSLKQILEEKRKKKEERDGMIKELVELEFPEWRRGLTQEAITAIVPEETLKTNLSPAITAALRTYFVENIILPKIEIIDG